VLQNRPEETRSPENLPQQELSFTDAVEQYQQYLILQALKNTDGVKSKAAALLKMNRTTLVEKIKKLKIQQPQ
jgi:DNA-binding NtrC family response regulator